MAFSQLIYVCVKANNCQFITYEQVTVGFLCFVLGLFALNSNWKIC